jgi:hypothetical protein
VKVEIQEHIALVQLPSKKNIIEKNELSSSYWNLSPAERELEAPGATRAEVELAEPWRKISV